MSQRIRILPGHDLGIGALLCSSVVTKCRMVTNNSVKNVSVTLWFCFQRSCKKFL